MNSIPLFELDSKTAHFFRFNGNIEDFAGFSILFGTGNMMEKVVR